MSNTAELTPVNTKQLVNYFTNEELDVVKTQIAKGATNEELSLFIQICKHNQLDPFKSHVYFIKYGGQMSIQVSVEGILYLARQQEDFKGVSVQLVHENDTFELELDTETQELKVSKHVVSIPRGKVAACYAIAKRESYPDKVVIIETDEVEHLKNKPGSLWKNHFNDMFKKHTLKRALRLQFCIDVEDEQTPSVSVSTVDSYDTRQRVDITPSSQTIEVSEDETVDEEVEKKKIWDEINGKIEQYNITREDVKHLVVKYFNKKPIDLTLQNLVALSKFIDMEHKHRQYVQNLSGKESIENMSFDDFE